MIVSRSFSCRRAVRATSTTSLNPASRHLAALPASCSGGVVTEISQAIRRAPRSWTRSIRPWRSSTGCSVVTVKSQASASRRIRSLSASCVRRPVSSSTTGASAAGEGARQVEKFQGLLEALGQLVLLLARGRHAPPAAGIGDEPPVRVVKTMHLALCFFGKGAGADDTRDKLKPVVGIRALHMQGEPKGKDPGIRSISRVRDGARRVCRRQHTLRHVVAHGAASLAPRQPVRHRVHPTGARVRHLQGNAVGVEPVCSAKGIILPTNGNRPQALGSSPCVRGVEFSLRCGRRRWSGEPISPEEREACYSAANASHVRYALQHARMSGFHWFAEGGGFSDGGSSGLSGSRDLEDSRCQSHPKIRMTIPSKTTLNGVIIGHLGKIGPPRARTATLLLQPCGGSTDTGD